jgi:hypothetical protein
MHVVVSSPLRQFRGVMLQRLGRGRLCSSQKRKK